MTVKRMLTLSASLLAAALAVAAFAAAAPNSATLLIRHQTRGCHSWSVNGGPFNAIQTLILARGATLKVTNDDVMPHKLVQTAGPAALLHRSSTGMMAHMGAGTTVTFPVKGVYRFTTKPGEDYVHGVNTTGPDNVLRLTVHVG